MYNRQESNWYNSIVNGAKRALYSAAVCTGLAGIVATTGVTTAGCGPHKKKVFINVPGQPPVPNGAPTLDALMQSYTIGVGQTLIVPLTGRDDFSPGSNVNGVLTPTQPLALQVLPGTTDTKFTVTKGPETIANPLRVVTGNAIYTSPATDTPGLRSYVVMLDDGDSSDIEVVNITVTAAPVPPGSVPGGSVLGGGSSGGSGTSGSGNP